MITAIVILSVLVVLETLLCVHLARANARFALALHNFAKDVHMMLTCGRDPSSVARYAQKVRDVAKPSRKEE